MRILVVNSLSIKCAIGGAERSVQYTAEALVKRGHSVTILALAPKGYEKLWSADICDEVCVLTTKLYNIYWPFSENSSRILEKILFNLLDIFNPFEGFCFMYYCIKTKPDVVWTNMLKGWSLSVWVVAKMLDVPIVATLREYDLIFTGKMQKQKSASKNSISIFGILKRLFEGLPTAVIGISESIICNHNKFGYFKNNRIKGIIGNPVKCGNEKLEEIGQKAIGVPIRVGWLGRFGYEKGTHVYLNVVRHFKNDSVLQFHIAGDGSNEICSIVEEMNNCNIIRNHGYCSSSEFLKNIDVLVVSSLWEEPFGRVVIEGFQNFCYVISSNRGGLLEINDDISCGKIYDGSESGLIAAMVEIKTNPPVLNIVRFLEKVEKFSPGKISSEYEKVFEDAIGESKNILV